MESVEFIQWCLDNLNYLTITLLMTIESSFIPFPSEIVIIPAAYKAAAGELNMFLVVLFGTIGANLGAIINYYLSLWIGRPVVYKFANSRIGHMCLLDQSKIEKAERYFDKHGSVSTFVGRLIPGIRQLISIPAGLSRMNFGKFILFTALGAMCWNIILAIIGYWGYQALPQDELIAMVQKYSHEFFYVFIGLCVLIIAFLVYKGIKKKKNQKQRV